MTPRRLAWRRVLALRAVTARRRTGFEPSSRALAGSGGPTTEMAWPPGLRTRRDLARFSPPRESRTTS
ncbi:hypothetical protein K701_13430 [Streptomyces fradiae ATCC 10745 = DSM 40063]|uniref:Uncharacterized protein n=1 Tax=Streptomyces fradiae ATCC 10745 = DSM 40063 TaxID=1319510 RepID=A0ABQ6XUC9_STRFR|nr:hypothetical protein K701_13430 [Streptomyces fradiae ATCC 10745 = DSM 40063]